MNDYEIDFNEIIDFKIVKKLFEKNGFLHLKNILNLKEITKLKKDILKEFSFLDKQNLNDEDKRILNRCEMPVIHNKSPRIDINSYKAHINSKLIKILRIIFEEEFFWHFPPQIRRLSIEKDTGLLPFHQDYYYNDNYENIIVCWTPLSKCGVNSPSLELVRRKFITKLEHQSNQTWEFGISSEVLKKYVNEDDIIPLKNVNISDVVIFDSYTLHRTYKNKNMSEIRYSIDFRCIKRSFIPESLLKQRKYVCSKNLEFIKEDI